MTTPNAPGFRELGIAGEKVFFTNNGGQVVDAPITEVRNGGVSTQNTVRQTIVQELTDKKSKTNTPRIASSIYTLRRVELNNDNDAKREVENAAELAKNSPAFQKVVDSIYKEMQLSANQKTAGKKIPGLTDRNGDTISQEDFGSDLAYVALQQLARNDTPAGNAAGRLLEARNITDAEQRQFTQLLDQAYDAEVARNPALVNAPDATEDQRRAIPPMYRFDHTPAEENLISLMCAASAKSYTGDGSKLRWNAGVTARLILRDGSLKGLFADAMDGTPAADSPPEPEGAAEAQQEAEPQTFTERLLQNLRENHRTIITAAAILAAAGGVAGEVGRRRNQNPNRFVTRLMQAGAFTGVAIVGGGAAMLIARRLDRMEDQEAANTMKSTASYGLGAAAVFYVGQALYNHFQRANATPTPDAGAPQGANQGPQAEQAKFKFGLKALDDFIAAVRERDANLEGKKKFRDVEDIVNGAPDGRRRQINRLANAIGELNEKDEAISILGSVTGGLKKFIGTKLKIEGPALTIVNGLVDSIVAAGRVAERLENKAEDLLAILQILDGLSIAKGGAEYVHVIVKSIGEWLLMDPAKQKQSRIEREAEIQDLVREYRAATNA